MDSEETYSEAQANLLLGIPTLTKDAENIELSKPIMEFEIKTAIWSVREDKALGPDGFSIKFYRIAWEIIKEDLKRMLNWTRKKYKIGKAKSSSFLSLIPKENNPLSLDRFRPISLCKTPYKILSKILVNRMKNNMGCLISNS